MRRFFAAVVFALLLAACSDPVNRDNYERVEADMPESRVLEILGEPDRSRSGSFGGVSGTQHSWDGDGFVITIQFLNGRVASKQLMPAE